MFSEGIVGPWSTITPECPNIQKKTVWKSCVLNLGRLLSWKVLLFESSKKWKFKHVARKVNEEPDVELPTPSKKTKACPNDSKEIWVTSRMENMNKSTIVSWCQSFSHESYLTIFFYLGAHIWLGIMHTISFCCCWLCLAQRSRLRNIFRPTVALWFVAAASKQCMWCKKKPVRQGNHRDQSSGY